MNSRTANCIAAQLLFCAFASAAIAQNTTMFRNDPAHSATYSGGVPQFHRVRWTFRTRGEVVSSPAIVDGVVYVGSNDGNLYAIDQRTGTKKWNFATDARIPSSPAVADGLVYFASYDGNFYAVDAATGKVKWKFGIPGERRYAATHLHGSLPAGETMPDPFDGIQSSAAVAGGIVYFGCRDSNLYALDAATGGLKWKFNTKGSWVVASPVVHEGKVYFATSDSALLHVADARTGALIDTLKFHWPMFGSPAIAGNTLYQPGNDGKLVAIDLGSRKIAWTFESEGSKKNLARLTKPDGSPNYEAVFTTTFYDDVIVGVSRTHSVGTMQASPVISGSTIYIGSSDGNLYALE